MDERATITEETSPDVIARDILRTREKLSRTMQLIGEKFSGDHIRGVVKETLMDKAGNALARGKQFAGKAKLSAGSIGATVQRGASRAGSRMLRLINSDPVAARVIAFELGVLTVLAVQGLKSRRIQKQIREKSGGSLLSEERPLSIEEVRDKVKAAALIPDEELKKSA